MCSTRLSRMPTGSIRQETMAEYYCPTCESTDVDVYKFPDEPEVHIYCQENGCGGIHRSVDVGTL